MKYVFLFIDGVGIAPPSPDNPVNPEVCPTLCRLVAEHGKPIDANLGIPGLPQSATGQATMFTGVNAPKFMGRHCEGFPGPGLRDLVSKDNIFLRLKGIGKKVKFADAYLVESADELESRRFKSVTTVMALSVPESVSTISDLADDIAVLQDLTRATISDSYPEILKIEPEDAARHLFDVARGHDFTLFEYFQTDVAGHSMDYDRSCSVLREYDAFLSTLVRFTEAAGITLVATSDHGNVEASNERGHTRNPVPFIAFGPKEAELRDRVESLADVTPAILQFAQS